MKALVSILIFMMFCQMGSAGVVHVPNDVPTIQAGVDAASIGDTVLVAPGTYTGDGNRDIDFGGKNIVLKSYGGPEATIITGSGRGFFFHSGEDSNSVVEGFTISGGYLFGIEDPYGAGIMCDSSSPKIINNRIINNTSSGGLGPGHPAGGLGGGIYCRNSEAIIIDNLIMGNQATSNGAGIYYIKSCLTICGNTIIGNQVNYIAWSVPCEVDEGSGGGIYCYESFNTQIIDNTFEDNIAFSGSGVFIRESTAWMMNNRLIENMAYYYGGGVVSYKATLVLDGNLISNNYSSQGGALYCYDSQVDIDYSTFAGNYAQGFNYWIGACFPGKGGGMYVSSSFISIENTIIFGNHASGPCEDNSHGSIYCCQLSDYIISCSDIFGNIVDDNEPSDWVECIADSYGIDGNFSSDPMFCNTDSGDYNISYLSPCAPDNNECNSLIGSENIMYCQNSSVIAIDKSGSMFYTNPLGESRLERAKSMAHNEIDKLLDFNNPDYPGDFQVGIMSFNADGIILLQDFTDDATALHTAIDSIHNPRHDTPLAAAMCQAHCLLDDLQADAKHVITFTDGLENESHNFEMCTICEPCNYLMSTGWDYDCDPSNPESCTDWQLCLADQFASSGINIVHYFGEPINPFDKGSGDSSLEDMLFLKSTAEESDGGFFYHSDQTADGFICGDANRDFDVNVSDAVAIINYIFTGGEPPNPFEAGDANCDALVNVSDAVYIINFVFLGGYEPCDTDGDTIPNC